MPHAWFAEPWSSSPSARHVCHPELARRDGPECQASVWRAEKKGKTSGKTIRIEMEYNRIVFVLTLDGDKLNGEIDDADEPGKVGAS